MTSRFGAFSFNYAVVCRVSQAFSERDIPSNKRKTDETDEEGQNDNEDEEQDDKKLGDNDTEGVNDGDESEQNIDYKEACVEQRKFIEALQKCKVTVVELPEDDDYKDSCRVEDCAVVIGDTALITCLGQASRRGETKAIRRVLESDLKLEVVEITDGRARLDGGDVLFTGKEILVGVGKNTNEQGAQAVAKTFPDYMVVPIDIGNLSCLHLKSICSMAGNLVIAISSSRDGEVLMKLIKENAQFSYALLKMDSDEAANMIFVNGRLIHRTRDEMNNTSYSILDEKIDPHGRYEVSIRVLARAGVTLSSLVLLINKQRSTRKLISNLQDQDLDRYATTEFVKSTLA